MNMDFDHESHFRNPQGKSEKFWRGVRETIALAIAITVILWIG